MFVGGDKPINPLVTDRALRLLGRGLSRKTTIVKLVAETLGGTPYRLALKQLYHDREEVTGWLRRG